MSDTPPPGQVRHEREGHILKVIIDNPAKRNAFDPEMMAQLSDALTLLDRDDDLWVGVLCAVGDNFTAGLDMPKFFGPTAKTIPRPEGNVDPFGMGVKCRKPIVAAVQGITFTVGIEMALAGDIVIAADDCRFCQMEAKRGIAPLGGAHYRYISRAGWGNAMYHLMLCDEFGAAEAYRIGLVQEVVPAGEQVERAMPRPSPPCRPSAIGSCKPPMPPKASPRSSSAARRCSRGAEGARSPLRRTQRSTQPPARLR